MGKKYYYLTFFIPLTTVLGIFIGRMYYENHPKLDAAYYKNMNYYIGKVEKINVRDGITAIELTPVKTERVFLSQIESNHQIQYNADSIGVHGLVSPGKDYKKLKLGELTEIIKSVKVGNNIIVKLKTDYDKSQYNLDVDSLAVDNTID